MNLIELTKKYFIKFSNKNINSLANIFAEDIVLIDWELNQSGKVNVLTANKNIFDSVSKILVQPVNLSQTDNIVFAEIIVRIDDTVILNVVDVITFDKRNKIQKIVAYKR